ncbi:hypothetical protein FQR65_LT10267 [Abscondita terminalis]|nr:hypothetical protein FQR65_LT10267 [Abscondita terminalis]
MLKVCLWRQEEMVCDGIFNSAITDDGLCCTFNALPQDIIFKNSRDMAGLNLTFPPEVDDWNPENGYSPNASINALPWRAAGAGSHLGLSVVLDAQLKSYYCSSTAGVGFKVLLHNPLETPKMAEYASLIAPGLESRMVVQPKIYDASQTIRGIDINKRMCYFSNEKDLQFYRTYTELNCKLECQANYTLNVCGCVPFYLPKNRFKKICSKKQESCISMAKEVMEIPNQNGTNCGCLPACFELGFESSVTFGKFTNTFKIKEQFIKNESIDYFIKNMAIIHFFFVESQFIRNTKTELYGFSEFLFRKEAFEMSVFPKELRLERTQTNRGTMYPHIDADIYLNNNTPIGKKFSVVKQFMNVFHTSRNNIDTEKNLWVDSYGNAHTKKSLMHPSHIQKVKSANDDDNQKVNFCSSILGHIEDYFSNSTLHGLRYIGDTTISFGERIFWLVAFITAIFCAAYFITSIYAKYNLNPVIISLNPRPTPIGALPFPAITICSMNQAKRREADSIVESGTEVEKMLLDDYCNSNNSFSNLTSTSDEATKWENVLKFILRVNPSCQEILKVCLWKQETMECEDLFNSALTDDGLCCTFNALPKSYIFRNPREMAGLNLTFPPEVDDWNPENGYSENSTAYALPWRAAGAGTHLGLTLVLDAQLSSYYCSSSTGVGFKVLLHNPLETPKMADFALLVAPGLEARVAIHPKLYDASQTIRGIEIRKRMCYFTNERSLQFYRTYTELNCKLECQANYTLQLCGCVPFYLPKNRFKKICSKRQEACSNLAKTTMEVPDQNRSSCNCLPACFELGFGASVTFGKLSNLFKVKDNIIRNESIDYFTENMAVLHFYFTDSQFTRNTKSELYGFSEFLSNTGGLLGLFLGFSALSVVEIFYYLTLKPCCRTIRSQKKNKRKVKKKTTMSDKDAKLLYPFAR